MYYRILVALFLAIFFFFVSLTGCAYHSEQRSEIITKEPEKKVVSESDFMDVKFTYESKNFLTASLYKKVKAKKTVSRYKKMYEWYQEYNPAYELFEIPFGVVGIALTPFAILEDDFPEYFTGFLYCINPFMNYGDPSFALSDPKIRIVQKKSMPDEISGSTEQTPYKSTVVSFRLDELPAKKKETNASGKVLINILELVTGNFSSLPSSIFVRAEPQPDEVLKKNISLEPRSVKIL